MLSHEVTLVLQLVDQGLVLLNVASLVKAKFGDILDALVKMDRQQGQTDTTAMSVQNKEQRIALTL